MNWVKGKYFNMEQSGDYSVTGHADPKGGNFYIAFWKQHVLSGSCETAEAARGVCEKHAEKRN